MKLNEIEIPHLWFLYTEFELTDDFGVTDAEQITRRLGGRAAYFHHFATWNKGLGEVAFNTHEEAYEAKKKLRRMSRGKPRFTTRVTYVSQEPKIVSNQTQIQ